ncbi:hypothetical protein LTR36_000422 [Oleoguttula mirabilis]|uniref:F-box domain-containing protein n=1 Tax=Oleoguttula mirabilis TaxID=1507867 RepID=A0AAV9JYQ9_9PEZI|nr:hypothetical protein LTR36_000422 [Oleoguttula mirabilis]
MAPAGTKRRSVRQATTRRHERSVYVDPESDEDDFEAEAEAEDDFEPEQEAAHAPPQKRRRVAPKTKHITRSKSVSKSKAGVKLTLKGVGKRRRWNKALVATPRKDFNGPTDGKIPAWTSLPLEILRDIFIYASRPLHDSTSLGNVDWLMKTARVCRAFAQPALEAYYISPSLLAKVWPHHLLELLRLPREKRYMDYNVKPRNVSIHVGELAYTAHNKPLFDLSTLLRELPQLQHLEVLHPVDEPPFRPGPKMQPWHYPSTMFRTLQEVGQRLKSFRWNRDMINVDASDLYGFMAQTHLGTPFEYLERLTVCRFNYTDSAEPTPEEGSEIAAPAGLSTSIALLPHLKDLTFVSCDVITDKFLERLPKFLQRLELTNCLEVTSDMLQTYLAVGGSELRELVLNHNISLNLAFLPGLKTVCPKLEVLKMELQYYSERMNSDDAAPLYDELITAAEVPTWPATLRHLELIHIQRCSPEAAQNIFRSLVDGAQELPDLRNIVLHSHINIPWRDRAGFRDQWIDRLRRVYLRDNKPACPHLGSLRQYRLFKQAQGAGRGIPPLDKLAADAKDEDFTIGRSMSHIRVSPNKPHNGDTDVYSDSSPDKSRPKRRSRRVAAASQASAASQSASPPAADSESEADDDNNDEDDWRKQPETHIQGLCSVVDVRIDNQRPRENQFTEGDFLDSEASGDEDWHEGADGDDEEGYAW